MHIDVTQGVFTFTYEATANTDISLQVAPGGVVRFQKGPLAIRIIADQDITIPAGSPDEYFTMTFPEGCHFDRFVTSHIVEDAAAPVEDAAASVLTFSNAPASINITVAAPVEDAALTVSEGAALTLDKATAVYLVTSAAAPSGEASAAAPSVELARVTISEDTAASSGEDTAALLAEVPETHEVL